MVIKLVKAYRGECHATPWGYRIRRWPEIWMWELSTWRFQFPGGMLPTVYLRGGLYLYYYLLLVKRRKNVGSVGCVGQTEKSPQKASREVFQITYTNYTNYITRRNTAVCQTIHGPMDRLNEWTAPSRRRPLNASTMKTIASCGHTLPTSWQPITSPAGSRPSMGLRPMNTSARSGHLSQTDSF